MSWNQRLKEELAREDIPRFLVDLQGVVESLRNGQAWSLSPILRAHPELVLEYMTPGEKRDAVKKALSTP